MQKRNFPQENESDHPAALKFVYSLVYSTVHRTVNSTVYSTVNNVVFSTL